jgi:hypothetical protein
MSEPSAERLSAEQFYELHFEPKVQAGTKGLRTMFLFAEVYAAYRLAGDNEAKGE